MNPTTIITNSIEDFAKQINGLRKTGKWYAVTGQLNGKQFLIKGYNTWLQIYKVNGIDCSNVMGENVKEFNVSLQKPFIQ